MVDALSPPFIFKRRIHKPPLPADLVVRQLLFDQLDQAEPYPFTLVCAPAGYGKSTLLSSWLEGVKRPYAWLNLDVELSDYYLFLTYLTAALQDVYPGQFEDLAALLSGSQNPPVLTCAAVLCDELYDLEQGLILVLNDYHLIRNKNIDRLLAAVFENAPPAFQLVLITRWNPALPLTKWRARARLLELRAEQLRFQNAESRFFLQAALPEGLPDEVVETLCLRTEGWIASLRLIVLSLQSAGDPQAVLETLQQGSDTLVSAYLLDQVYAALPETIQEFLIKTSLLTSLNPDLCDALDLPGGMPSRTVLTSLADSNMLLIPLDQQGSWFRYHQLVRDDLSMRLRRQNSAEEIASLHRKAAHWLADTGNVEEAMQHYLAADDMDSVTRLIEAELPQLLDNEDWRTLQRWMIRLPESLVEQRPGLLVGRALVLHFQWRLAALPPVLDQIEAQLNSVQAGDVPSNQRFSRAILLMLRSQQAFWSGQWRQSLEWGLECLSLLSKEHHFARGFCELYIGFNLQALGREAEAIDRLGDSLFASGQPFNSCSVRVAMGLSQIYLNRGYLEQAEQVGSLLLEKSVQLEFPLGQAWGDYFLGKVALEQGDPGRAQRHFQIVAKAPHRAHLRAAHECFLGLALVYQAQGAPQLADRALDSAEAQALSAENQQQLSEVTALRARLALARGENERAFGLLQPLFDVPLPPTPYIFLEIPHLTLARAWIACDQETYCQRALALLDQLLALAEDTHNFLRQGEIRAVRALAHQALGEKRRAAEDLAQALTLAGSSGTYLMLLELWPQLQPILDRGEVQLRALAEPLRQLDRARSAALVVQGAAAGPPPADLSGRELEVLALLAKRHKYEQIADELVISPLTVKTHARNIYKKLGVNGSREAVNLARQLKLLA